MTDPFDEKLAETIKAGRTNDAEFIAHARQDIPALLAAVEAVLELHKPEATGYGDWVCGACISAGSHDWESTAYPCPTVQAIHQALGEGEK